MDFDMDNTQSIMLNYLKAMPSWMKCREQGKHWEALDHLEQMAKYSQNDMLGTFLINMGFSEAYESLCQYDKALYYVELSFDVIANLHDAGKESTVSDEVRQCLIDWSVFQFFSVLTSFGEYDYAEQCYRLVMKRMGTFLNPGFAHIQGLLSFARMFYHKREYEKAKVVGEAAKGIYGMLEYGSHNIEAEICYLLSDIYSALDEPKKMSEMLEYAIIIYAKNEEYTNYRYWAMAYEHTARLFDRHNLKPKAVTNYVRKLAALMPQLYAEVMEITSDDIRIAVWRGFHGMLQTIHNISRSRAKCISDTDSYNLLLKSKDLLAEADYVINKYLPKRYEEFENKKTEFIDKRVKVQGMKSMFAEIWYLGKEGVFQEKHLFKAMKIIKQNTRNNFPGNKIDELLSNASEAYEKGIEIPRHIAVLTCAIIEDVICVASLLCNGKLHIEKFDITEIKNLTKSLQQARGDTARDKVLHSMYQLFILPFADKLRNVKTLIMVPCTKLYELPFGRFIDEHGTALSDKFYVDVSKDLTQFYGGLQDKLKNMMDDLTNYESDCEHIEREIAPHVRQIDFASYMSNMNADCVLKNIPKDSALLEYGCSDFGDGGGVYYAYIVIRGEKIKKKYLKDYEEINNTINSLRKKIEARNELHDDLKKLWQMLVEPVISRLKGIKHLYIAPDGELFKLPFELLLSEKGTSLAEMFAVSFVSTGRDFSRFGKRGKRGYTSAAIIADPLYDIEETTKKSNANVSSKQSRSTVKLEAYSQLRYATLEAKMLVEAFDGKPTERYLSDATKYALAEVGSPDIIHIATHGFSHENQPFSNEYGIAETQAEYPMVRCGLIFSGANNWLKSTKTSEKHGDGILNAKEVLKLDLFETDLLVLSACQTGIGETKNGEGIKSLRRSFELVGVRSIVCTLWSVDDLASSILMTKFYDNLFTRQMNKSDALYHAKKYIRTMTYLQLFEYCQKTGIEEWAEKIIDLSEERLNETSYYTHPYYWAGYILQGDIE